MSSYTIRFTRSARKELEQLPLPVENRIARKLDELGPQARPPGCLKLQGQNDLWRIRVGDYRVVYRIDDLNKVVDIVRVRHRKNAYE